MKMHPDSKKKNSRLRLFKKKNREATTPEESPSIASTPTAESSPARSIESVEVREPPKLRVLDFSTELEVTVDADVREETRNDRVLEGDGELEVTVGDPDEDRTGPTKETPSLATEEVCNETLSETTLLPTEAPTEAPLGFSGKVLEDSEQAGFGQLEVALESQTEVPDTAEVATATTATESALDMTNDPVDSAETENPETVVADHGLQQDGSVELWVPKVPMGNSTEETAVVLDPPKNKEDESTYDYPIANVTSYEQPKQPKPTPKQQPQVAHSAEYILKDLEVQRQIHSLPRVRVDLSADKDEDDDSQIRDRYLPAQTHSSDIGYSSYSGYGMSSRSSSHGARLDRDEVRKLRGSIQPSSTVDSDYSSQDTSDEDSAKSSDADDLGMELSEMAEELRRSGPSVIMEWLDMAPSS